MIAHHPNGETLLRFSTGDLAAAPALVVATHIAQCAECRAALRELESVGGATLDAIEPVTIRGDIAALLADPDAAARRFEEKRRAAAQIGLFGRSLPEAEKKPASTIRQRPPLPDDMHLPGPLAAYDISAWRFVAPRIQWAKVAIPGDPSAKVLLLKAAPGAALPLHTHTGVEYTCILYGAFHDGDKVLRTGDLVECDEEHRHQPAVDMAGQCICVLAIDGKLVMEGWIARLAQRIVGL